MSCPSGSDDLVLRVFRFAACVTRHGFLHARNVLENTLHAPEASAREHGGFDGRRHGFIKRGSRERAAFLRHRTRRAENECGGEDQSTRQENAVQPGEARACRFRRRCIHETLPNEKRRPNVSDTFHTSKSRLPLHDGCGNAHRDMREIFEPSSVRLYIRPFGSRMKPTTGLVILLVSTDPPTPTVMIATEPSTPTFQPDVRRN